MNSNRSALWAIIGVVLGFSLPFMACGGLFLIVAWGAGSAGGSGGTMGLTATGPTAHYVSGPTEGPAVALLEIEGLITSGGGESGFPGLLDSIGATPDRLIPLIKAAAADEEVRAILVKVNSPGGAVVATDEIYHALQTAVDKPIVVLMGDVAASGGVYVSMAADYILANPNTLTGSIGVRLNDILEYGDLLQQLGVDVTTIKAGEFKDLGSSTRPMTVEEQAILQAVVDDSYANFVGIVAAGRGLTEAVVRNLPTVASLAEKRRSSWGWLMQWAMRKMPFAKPVSWAASMGSMRVIRYGTANGLLDQLLTTSMKKMVAMVRAEFADATVRRLEYR
ncbi:MAG: signal peptide peptidase SppA [Caldilineaceae bacterium]